MVAYIKEDLTTSLFEQAACGFTSLGYGLIYYKNNINNLLIGEEVVCVGYVKDIHDILQLNGKPIPAPINYPEQLQSELGRQILKSDLHSAISAYEFPLFVKPVGHKSVSGRVARSYIDLAGLNPNVEVWHTSQILGIISEYRVYVIDGNIHGVKHYRGCPFTSPNKDTVLGMINKYTQSPKVYSLDVGVLKDGKNILVEVNHGYSSGNYGLSDENYAIFLKEAWKSIVN